MIVPENARADHAEAAIEDLVAANNKSNATMLALVENVRQETVARDRKIDVLERNHRQVNFLIAAVCMAIVVLLALGITNAINLASARRQQEQTKEINSTLLDCVRATGECGQLNSARQAAILQSVKQYELTGFYCIRINPATADPKGQAFLDCMERLYPGGPTLSGR